MIGDDFAAALVELRGLAESTMTDTVRIERPGSPLTDQATGAVSTPRVLIYEGRGKVLRRDATDFASEAGTSTATRPVVELGLPVSSCQPRKGDIATIIASTHDPSMAGTEAVIDTHATPVSRATKIKVIAEVIPRG